LEVSETLNKSKGEISSQYMMKDIEGLLSSPKSLLEEMDWFVLQKLELILAQQID